MPPKQNHPEFEQLAETAPEASLAPYDPYRMLGDIALHTGPIIEIPSTERTREVYAVVQAELGITLPGDMNLGQLLMRLHRQQQHMFRARYGMYPFIRRHSIQDLAGIYEQPYATARSRWRFLRQGMLDVTRFVQRPSNVGSVTLEMLAQRLDDPLFAVHYRNKLVIRAAYGLPPYPRPMIAAKIGELIGVTRPATITKYIQGTLRSLDRDPLELAEIARLEAATERSSESFASTHPEQAKLFMIRDAGRYAELLQSLRATETRLDWLRILRVDLDLASQKRAQAYERGMKGQSRLGGTFDEPGFIKQINYYHQRRLAHNPLLDTLEGHEELLSILVQHATDLSQEDAELLPVIIEDGRIAREVLKAEHLNLIFFALKTISQKHKIGFRRLSLDAAEQGLIQAVNGFDSGSPNQFAPYALRTIAGAMFRAGNKEVAASYNIGTNALWSARKVIEVVRELENETGRRPTDAEVAAKAGIKNVSRVKRYRENMERNPGTISSEAIEVEHGRSPLDTIAVVQSKQAETDDDAREFLGEALANLFSIAGLTGDECDILCGTFGIPPYIKPLSDTTLADQLNLSIKEVEELYASAATKLRAVEGLKTLLLNNLRGPTEESPE